MHFEPALVPYLIFSDHVIREEGSGKHSIIGAFQHFTVARFPFLAAPFFVTVSFGNLRGEIEKLNLTLRAEQSTTGVVLACVTSEIRLRGDIQPQDCFDVPFRLPPIQFPSPGAYAMTFLINNEIIGTRPLMIRLAAPPQLEE
jgi:hypothetical protein